MGKLRMAPLFFHLLLSLSKGVRHGYALMQEIEERTGGSLILGPSSLYYALGRLQDSGLIEEVRGTEVSEGPHEERRRYYRLTGKGLERLGEETSLLADIVSHARVQGLIG